MERMAKCTECGKFGRFEVIYKMGSHVRLQCYNCGKTFKEKTNAKSSTHGKNDRKCTHNLDEHR